MTSFTAACISNPNEPSSESLMIDVGESSLPLEGTPHKLPNTNTNNAFSYDSPTHTVVTSSETIATQTSVSSIRSSLMQVDSPSSVFIRKQKNEVEQELQAVRNRKFGDLHFKDEKENHNKKVLKNASSSSVSKIRKSLLRANQTCSSTKLLQKQQDQIKKELEALKATKATLNSPQETSSNNVNIDDCVKVQFSGQSEISLSSNEHVDNLDENDTSKTSNIYSTPQHDTISPTSVKSLRQSIESRTPQRVVASLEEYFLLQKEVIVKEKEKENEAITLMNSYHGPAALLGSIFETSSFTNECHLRSSSLNDALYLSANRAASIAYKYLFTLPEFKESDRERLRIAKEESKLWHLKVHIFVIHREHGLGMILCNCNKECKDDRRVRMTGGEILDHEILAAIHVCGKDKHERLLTASKLSASRLLFSQTGIDVRKNLERIEPYNFGCNNTERETSMISCQRNGGIYFYVTVDDEDLPKEHSTKKYTLIFEKEPSKFTHKICNDCGNPCPELFGQSTSTSSSESNLVLPFSKEIESNIVQVQVDSNTEKDDCCKNQAISSGRKRHLMRLKTKRTIARTFHLLLETFIPSTIPPV